MNTASGQPNSPATMADPIEGKLVALSKAGRILRAFFFLLFGVFSLFAIVFTALLIMDVAQRGIPAGGLLSSLLLPLASISAFLVFAITFYISALVFSDISHGESPFTIKQSRRIRIIAWLLFAYAVIDTLAPKGLIADGGYIGDAMFVVRFEPGYTVINIGMFASAMIFYFLSSVFKYGVALQEISDDTV